MFVEIETSFKVYHGTVPLFRALPPYLQFFEAFGPSFAELQLIYAVEFLNFFPTSAWIPEGIEV